MDCARRNKLGTSHDRAQLSTADQPSTAGHSRVQPRTADQPSEPCSHQDRKAARLLVQAFFFLFRFMRFDSYLRVMHCFFFKTVSTCKHFSYCIIISCAMICSRVGVSQKPLQTVHDYFLGNSPKPFRTVSCYLFLSFVKKHQ